MEIATQQDRSGLGRFQPLGALFTSGSLKMQEIADAGGVDDIVAQIKSVVDPLLVKLAFYTSAVRQAKQAVAGRNSLGQVDPELLAVAGQIAPAFGPTGMAIGLALNLTAGLISAGNAEKEQERAKKVAAGLTARQAPLNEQVERAIVLLAEAGDPESIAILASRTTGPNASTAKKRARTVAIVGAGVVAAGAAAFSFLGRPNRFGQVTPDPFQVALDQIIAQQAGMGVAIPIFERVFNPKNFRNAFPTSNTVRQFNQISDIIVELGDANNQLFLSLAIVPATDFVPLVAKVFDDPVDPGAGDAQLEADFRAGKITLTGVQWRRLAVALDDIKGEIAFSPIPNTLQTVVELMSSAVLNPDSQFFSKQKVLELMRERGDFDRARAKIIALDITSTEGAIRYARGTLFGIRRGRMSRARRRRRNGMSGTANMPFLGQGEPAFTNIQEADEFFQENSGDAIRWFTTMNQQARAKEDQAQSERVVVDGVDTNKKALRDIKWASDITQWTEMMLFILQSEKPFPEEWVSFFKSMTSKMTRHTRVVLKNQAQIFDDFGFSDRANQTRNMLLRFDQIQNLAAAVKRKPEAALSSGGLGGFGFIISGITAAWLVALALSALAVGAIYVSVSTVGAVNNNAAKNQVELENLIIRKILELEEEAATLRAAGDDKAADAKLAQADRLRDTAASTKKPLGILESAGLLFANLTTFVLVGAGIYVGFKFVLPGIRDLLRKRRRAAPALTADERKQPAPTPGPGPKPLSPGEERVRAELEARRGSTRAAMLG